MVNHYVYPWALPAVIVAVAVLAVLGWFARRPENRPTSVTWVANASYLVNLPSFKSRMSLYRMLIAVVAVVLLGATVAAGFLATRPVDRQVRSDELATRDIVLCLDVSGSMISYDTEVVERFLELLPSFQGERIALSIWNSTSRTVFPLTDDYALVEEELRYAAEILDFDVTSLSDWSFDPDHYDELIEYLGGTTGMGETESSLIGDGLASCALMFDEADTERSRSIILATDNDVRGNPVYTLPEAGDLIAERDISLFGIYAGDSTSLSAAQEKEYREVVEGHDGLFYEASDTALVSGVVDEIAAQQAAELDADSEVVFTDKPERFFAALVVAIAIYLLAVWRLRT
ncbi:MAG: vWA domain-containing protein [Beutenbergiaceae bacterium]